MKFFRADGCVDDIHADDLRDFGYLPFHACKFGFDDRVLTELVGQTAKRFLRAYATSEALFGLAKELDSALSSGRPIQDGCPGVIAVSFDHVASSVTPWVYFAPRTHKAQLPQESTFALYARQVLRRVEKELADDWRYADYPRGAVDDIKELVGALRSVLGTAPAVTDLHRPCQHGVKQPDCEVLCKGCRHPCRGHQGAVCSAAWAELVPSYEVRFAQHYCSCSQFQ